LLKNQYQFLIEHNAFAPAPWLALPEVTPVLGGFMSFKDLKGEPDAREGGTYVHIAILGQRPASW